MAGEPDVAAEVARLRQANVRLRDASARHAAELDNARRENAALRARVEELTAAVAQLRARLERNAKNSSLPPSSEGLGKPPARPRGRGGASSRARRGRIWRRSPSPTG